MMALLNDPTIWLLLSFIIFSVIIWRKGKDIFLSLLDQRIKAIRDEIETAENLRIESQELLAQYQRKHRDAVKEAQDIVENAERHAEKILKKAEAELAELTARREAQLEERLKRLEQNAISEIQEYAANLAIKATTEVINEKLDKKTQEKLVEHSIKELSSNIH